VIVSSPWRRAIDTVARALPWCQLKIGALAAEFDSSYPERLTSEPIPQRVPGWDIVRDGCPPDEATTDVGTRAAASVHANAETCTLPVVVVTHGYFSRILAARTLRLAPESGRLFASTVALISLIEDHRGERCFGLGNAATAVLEHPADRVSHLKGDGQIAAPQLPLEGRWL
jgi:broad specificity phosphatase PhoE